MAILPMSCSSAAASIAFSGDRRRDTELAREAIGRELHAADVAVRHLVLGIDRGRQRLDRGQISMSSLSRWPFASSTRPNEERNV